MWLKELLWILTCLEIPVSFKHKEYAGLLLSAKKGEKNENNSNNNNKRRLIKNDKAHNTRFYLKLGKAAKTS